MNEGAMQREICGWVMQDNWKKMNEHGTNILGQQQMIAGKNERMGKRC